MKTRKREREKRKEKSQETRCESGRQTKPEREIWRKQETRNYKERVR